MAIIKYGTAGAFRNTYFDNQGVPLIDGKLYSFKASDHITPKAIYQSNIITPPATTPPEYTNPIILNSGASVGQLVYADDEKYYLELRDKDDVVIDTVDNWPQEIETPSPSGDEIDLTDFLANSDFTQQIKSKFLKEELGTTEFKIAPPEWYFIRSNTNAEITIEFEKFLLGQTDVPNNPYAFLKYDCTNKGAGGEIHKDIYFKIKDVRSFENTDLTIRFYGKSTLGSQVQIYYDQIFGVSGSPAVLTTVGTATLTADWTEYTFTKTVPSIAGKTIDPDERGELHIIFRVPLNALANVQLSHFQMNRGTDKLEYQYLPQKFATGRNFAIEIPPKPIERYYGISGDETPYDWDLKYTTDQGFIWRSVIIPGFVLIDFSEYSHPYWLKVTGVNNLLRAEFPRIFTNLGTMYGSFHASATVAANKVTVTNLNNGVVTDAADVSSGFTITVTQQGTGILPEIFTVDTTAASAIPAPGSYFTFTSALGPTNWVVWIRIDGIGIHPVVAGADYINLSVNSWDDSNTVASKLRDALNPVMFGLPDLRGFFLRGQDHGAGVDPDAGTRFDRGDGTTGDNVGTKQGDEFKEHTHVPTLYGDDGFQNHNFPSGAHLAGDVSIYRTGVWADKQAMDSEHIAIANTGGAETRAKNIYAEFWMKI